MGVLILPETYDSIPNLGNYSKVTVDALFVDENVTCFPVTFINLTFDRTILIINS
jgi:hypothetical protein